MEPPNDNERLSRVPNSEPKLPMATLHLDGHLHSRPRRVQDVEDEELFQQLCHSLLGEEARCADKAPSPKNPLSSANNSSGSPSEESAGAAGAAEKWPNTLPRVLPKKESCPPNPSPASSPKRKTKAEDVAGTKRSQRMTRIKLTEAEELLQGLTLQHSRAEAENKRLHSRHKNLSACIEQADFQHRLDEVIHYGPRNPQPLPDSCSQVSFSELPPASSWDASWVARIAQLQPQDFQVLNRQWTQQSAVLLPQALAYGPGSEAYRKLEWLNDKHRDLARALVTLSPRAWLESSQYDMDTLMPIQMPTAEWMRDLLRRVVRPQALGGLVSFSREYHASSAALHAQYCQLLERYNALAGAVNLQPLSLEAAAAAGGAAGGSSSSSSSSSGGGGLGPRATLASHHSALEQLRLDCSPEYVAVLEQMDQVAQLLQANTSQHKSALLNYFTNFYHDFHPNRINFMLMTYPMANTAVDFIPGMLLLGDAASSSSPPDPAAPAPAPAPLP